VSLTGEDVIEDTDSTYVVRYDYQLGFLTDSYRVYIGMAIFRIKLNDEDGLWYIGSWEDSRSAAGEAAGKDTWGKLKGEIRATS
jgi:hypothetical protein